MARDVRVIITDQAIISALNQPGRPVSNWMEATLYRIRGAAQRLAPVNDTDNALHRGGVTGTYKASFFVSQQGSNQHRVRGTVFNTADHAYWVEYGRKRSHRYERFTWVHAYNYDRYDGERVMTPGATVIALHGTRGWPGHGVLVKACNEVMPGRTYGNYVPLAR